MQIGIVGLPYSGKTTFFQTLTESQLDPNALQKRDANIAIVKVEDKRLDEFTEIFQPKRKVNATIEIVDMAGITKGETAGSSITTQFLGKVKTNDALIHVVRGFMNEAIPLEDPSVDMVRDIKMLEDEFIFADLAFVEGRMDKLAKDIQRTQREDAKRELECMKRWNAHLEDGKPLRTMIFQPEDDRYLKNYQPLSAKPLLIALNISEDDLVNAKNIVEDVRKEINWENVIIEPFSAKIEMELMQLAPDEKAMFMEEYGLKESALARLVRSAYSLLGLKSFFTVGEDECRAWTIRDGMTAQDAAGVIHTDFHDKFIRAEVVSYKDFMANGSFAKCKEAGVFRLEGKEYVVCDGDILHVRHG